MPGPVTNSAEFGAKFELCVAWSTVTVRREMSGRNPHTYGRGPVEVTAATVRTSVPIVVQVWRQLSMVMRHVPCNRRKANAAPVASLTALDPCDEDRKKLRLSTSFLSMFVRDRLLRFFSGLTSELLQMSALKLRENAQNWQNPSISD